MIAIEAPAWCRWRRGRGAVLVIAPHGGRRDPAPPPQRWPRSPGARTRKVNDLHTADLAEELADALGASLIVNPALDRNRLDLNRISQVAARAPWFLTLIEALVDAILAHHPRAELLFVHGWNVIQPKCDIGIGHALADAAAAHERADALTVSPIYAAERLGSLQSWCAAAGIATTFGERYAARHPNNLLQLFRQTEACPQATPRLAEWVAAQRLEAVQLELGVPVRWPGPYRGGFLDAARAAFIEAATPPFTPSPCPTPSARGTPARSDGHSPRGRGDAPSSNASLQLYDPRAEVALTARVDGAGTHHASRLLIFLGGERLALFIGEDVRQDRPLNEGPHFTPMPHGFRLRFDGTALASNNGSLYLDLEQAFAASQLCAVAVDLRFRSQLSGEYGAAAGWIEVDGQRRSVESHAFARHGVLSGPPGAWSSQLALSAAFGPQRALRVRYEFPGRGLLRELTPRGEVAQALPPLTIHLADDRYTPERIAVGDALICEPLTRMAIVRPLPPHRQARVTFGPARFTCDGAEGFGFYEYARALLP